MHFKRSAQTLKLSIHVPARGTTYPRRLRQPELVLSIHVPARGTTEHDNGAEGRSFTFNPRSREGNDRGSLPVSMTLKLLSIHVPARGTTISSRSPSSSCHSFNPRSREGNDNLEDVCSLVDELSIHVPARGTTLVGFAFVDGYTLSIHVPARGTTMLFYTLHPAVYFQSTFPRGERLIYFIDTVQFTDLSIHVPARGTTLPHSPVRLLRQLSIHVPARGTTSSIRIPVPAAFFQSTFPRGERPVLPDKTHQSIIFQSTFPRGERQKVRWKIKQV